MADIPARHIRLFKFKRVLLLDFEDATNKIALVENAHFDLSVSAKKGGGHDVEDRLVEEVVPLVLEEEVDESLDDLSLQEGVKNNPAVGEGRRLDKLHNGVPEEAKGRVEGAKGELHGGESTLVLERLDAVVELGAHDVDDLGNVLGLDRVVVRCDTELTKDLHKNAYAVLSVTW